MRQSAGIMNTRWTQLMLQLLWFCREAKSFSRRGLQPFLRDWVVWLPSSHQRGANHDAEVPEQALATPANVKPIHATKFNEKSVKVVAIVMKKKLWILIKWLIKTRQWEQAECESKAAKLCADTILQAATKSRQHRRKGSNLVSCI